MSAFFFCLKIIIIHILIRVIEVKYYESVVELIGNTPLLRLKKIEKEFKLNYKLFAKIERFNPSGSIKDRASYFMIKDAINRKIINKDTLIIEPTSGNTGIGLALICAYYGLNLHIFMPSSFSKERRIMMEFLGAKVFLKTILYNYLNNIISRLPYLPLKHDKN